LEDFRIILNTVQNAKKKCIPQARRINTTIAIPHFQIEITEILQKNCPIPQNPMSLSMENACPLHVPLHKEVVTYGR